MIDRESQHEPDSGIAEKPQVGSDAIFADSSRTTPPVEKDKVTTGGSSFAASAGTPPIVPTDKTVISKRPPIESPLPVRPTSQSLGQTLIGKTLDHYELVEYVGGGGMGAVFRSIDTRLGRTVAVKVLSRDHTDDETIRRFRNEAQSAARLDHPNIARVYFVGEAEGWNYIVFEFIEGTNLRDIVDSSGPLPLERALDYTLQVAEALDHASQRDVVHRDIKPSNVLVTPLGQAKLVDMGLARLHQVESSSEDLTASGVMLGTFDYISPEQARDPRAADVRSDIYSLGCTLYFMLTGRPPFPEGTAVQKLLKHNSEEPPDLRLFRPELPPQVTGLVARMLAKRPSERQQSPQELIGEIMSLAQQIGLTGLSRAAGVAIMTQQPRGSIWSRLLPIAVPAAALVLLLLLIDSLSRQAEKQQQYVQRPKFDEGQAVQPAVTEPQDNAAVEAPIATTEKTNGPAIGKTANDDARSEGPDGSSEKTSSGNVAAASATGQGAARLTGSDNGTKNGAPKTGTVQPLVSPPGSIGSTASSVEGNKAPQRIIVRSAETELPTPDGAAVVQSLERACQLAVEHKLAKIELEFDGELTEQPFDVTLLKVEIVAAEKPAPEGGRFRPVIVFRPPLFPPDTDRQMIRLNGGGRSQIAFRGVELRLELPEEPSSGWSLLALHQLQSLELTDSVLTVKCPGGTEGIVGYEPVAMLALQPYRPAEMMKMTDDMMAMLPSINVRLTNCIARGEATFMTAVEERPLTIVWNQGLLVTPRRMIDTGGCSFPKPTQQDKFEILLDHVTAIVPQGLVRQNRSPAMPSHLRMEVRCYDSIVSVDEGNHRFEFGGMAREEVKLDFDGSDNLYPRNGGEFLRVGIDEEMVGDWAGARDTGSNNVQWLDLKPPPTPIEKPAHEHVPEDYQLEPQTKLGGFEPDALKGVLSGVPSAGFRDAAGTDTDFFDRPDSP